MWQEAAMQLNHPDGKKRRGRPPTEPRFDRLSAEQRGVLAAHLRLNRSNLHRYIKISDIMLSRGLGGGELPLRIFKKLSTWLEAHEPTSVDNVFVESRCASSRRYRSHHDTAMIDPDVCPLPALHQ
jgi:hypothetical protein